VETGSGDYTAEAHSSAHPDPGQAVGIGLGWPYRWTRPPREYLRSDMT